MALQLFLHDLSLFLGKICHRFTLDILSDDMYRVSILKACKEPGHWNIGVFRYELKASSFIKKALVAESRQAIGSSYRVQLPLRGAQTALNERAIDVKVLAFKCDSDAVFLTPSIKHLARHGRHLN